MYVHTYVRTNNAHVWFFLLVSIAKPIGIFLCTSGINYNHNEIHIIIMSAHTYMYTYVRYVYMYEHTCTHIRMYSTALR